jgi:ribosome-associated toxin RatA of RatAB toxin-antitoxin module
LVKAAALAVLILGAAAARSNNVWVTVEHRQGAYEVRGRFETTADSGVVWRVLSDYAQIPNFVESMKQSAVDERKGARVKVRQEAAVGVLPMRRRARLLLDVLERRPERIEFRDILEEDFHFYRGAWDIVADSTRTLVAYSLDTDPKTPAPSWLARGLMRKSAEQLLEQVRDEVERRAAAVRH